MAVYIGKPSPPSSKSKTLILLLPLGSPNPNSKPTRKWHLACFGNKRHYHKDGTCAHTDGIISAMNRDWYRQRTQFLPFGDNARKPMRYPWKELML